MPGLAERFDLTKLDQTPRPLAEQLDQDIALAGMRKYERKLTPSGWLRSAWQFAEYGLNAQADDPQEYFQTAQYLTGMVVNRSDALADVTMGALTLSTYLPLFRKRANQESITTDDIRETYRSIGQMIEHLRPLQIDQPPQWRMIEIGVLGLSARTGQPQHLLYPASPREEQSTLPAFNHDYYFIETGSKIPIQQKLLPTQKSYDEWVRVLSLEPIVDSAMKVAGVDQTAMELAEKMNYLLALIASETRDLPLTADEKKFLNFMTEAVVAHRVITATETEYETAA